MRIGSWSRIDLGVAATSHQQKTAESESPGTTHAYSPFSLGTAVVQGPPASRPKYRKEGPKDTITVHSNDMFQRVLCIGQLCGALLRYRYRYIHQYRGCSPLLSRSKTVGNHRKPRASLQEVTSLVDTRNTSYLSNGMAPSHRFAKHDRWVAVAAHRDPPHGEPTCQSRDTVAVLPLSD